MIDALNAAAVRAQTHPERVIDTCDWLGAAIDADQAAGRFQAWGSSTVIDENIGAAVLSPALFVALHARAGIAAQWPIGNAGVLHVYGYLLSMTATPYGLKRERWIEGSLARAYGLDAEAFVPWASTRTLLDRVSTAASGLLLRAVRRTEHVAGVDVAVAIDRAPVDGAFALAYAVDGRLVTSFPVAAPEVILAEWDAEPGRLRWNAVV